MFSALKRLTGKAEGGNNVPRPGHLSMSHSLQRKFAKGVHYNMKLIIKGDRNVGKTCLFHRLQGQKFIEEYIPTEEIQVASIQWSYKATDDIVKVEVWDVVDRGKKKRFDGLKLDNSQLEVPEEPALDAEFLDVYKGTNGVILMMDITKSWTFDYVQRELPKVPSHIPVLVLANHCDMAHHRTVTSDHVTYFIESQERAPRSAQVRYAESSMRNGFGLKLLHKFFNLPFLQLQKETLLGQLETNEHEIQLTTQELDLYQDSEDADYNKFIDNLMNKRRQAADMTSSAISSMAPANTSTSAQASAPTFQSNHQLSTQSSQTGNKNDSSYDRRSLSIPGPIGAGNAIPGTHPTLALKIVSVPVTSEQNKLPQPSGNVGSSTAVSNSQSQSHVPQQQMTLSQSVESLSSSARPDGSSMFSSKSSGFMSKIFGKSKDSQEELQPQMRRQSLASIATSEPITSVEEFVPDEGMLDRSFLEDTSVQERGTPQKIEAESDSDAETGNPLVAGFQDDLDPEDTLPNTITHYVNSDHTVDILKKRESLSSLENEVISENTKTDEKEELHLNGEVGDITADALDTWLSTDSKWRQSPEGGEDSTHSSNIVRKVEEAEEEDEDNSASLASSSVHLELLEPKQLQQSSGSSSPIVPREKKSRHKKKNEEKSMKKYKKKSSKEKDSSKSQNDEKKKKKKPSRKICEDEQEHDELEEFLNGPGLTPVDTAYEAI
ncbi:rab-like protein 6 isoform X2 [Zootermopsis nevadensis]|uniref:rab-like protein 6 isoform X2 n=1 Tax=Zootermopsis nevadensis TaxID=136037 RepID=UPI000B8E8932|nr:rab-like protein 6 isoform X2 [Zootermopsis nevadensis]